MISSSADLASHDRQSYEKRNVVYAMKAVESARVCLRRSQSLSLVLDEVAFLNTSVMLVFAASPLTFDVSQGWLLPPLMLPEMSICLKEKKVEARIQEAEGTSHGWPASAAKAGKNVRADPLVTTWHACSAIQKAVGFLLPEHGLQSFQVGAGAAASARGAYISIA